VEARTRSGAGRNLFLTFFVSEASVVVEGRRYCWASWKASDYAESEHGPSPSSRCHSMEIRHNRGVGMLIMPTSA
jgi:hypothetical protein